ncbi:MFS transporter [Streptomyces sp. CMB-StM0423]|uniref:MFS transporter n=1 Tax=Streptomyces sp. CMB-StM0423 TaxID=2059884 RepID=UPI001F283ECA|nr:MFS transporter [Streptomyces sp. CMB-StM0423]
MTRDPVAVAAVSVAAGLPWLLVSLPAGALADRVDRRRLMVAVQLVRMCLAALLTATVLAGRSSIAVLCAFVFLLGTGEVVFDAAARTLLGVSALLAGPGGADGSGGDGPGAGPGAGPCAGVSGSGS